MSGGEVDVGQLRRSPSNPIDANIHLPCLRSSAPRNPRPVPSPSRGPRSLLFHNAPSAVHEPLLAQDPVPLSSSLLSHAARPAPASAPVFNKQGTATKIWWLNWLEKSEFRPPPEASTINTDLSEFQTLFDSHHLLLLSVMSSLPQELVDSIVSGLDGYSSLRSCSLVSTSFVVPAQRIIFKSLRLEAGRHLKIEVVGDSLAVSPHIATYIRHLTIVLSDLEHEVHALESILLAVRNIEWSESCASDNNIIALPSLHALNLVAIFGLASVIIYSAASSVSTLGFHRVAQNQSNGEGEEISATFSIRPLPKWLVSSDCRFI
ncbi:hypothetical protein C8J57DRAFT_1530956 [Mycena rebaudengoi]|nr:hypothetical protein C8J57DRAFT_1530956 [Mycena rebaudengoi]